MRVLACTQKSFPAKALSVERFDNALFANTVVLGYIARTVEGLDKDTMVKAILEIIPKFHARNKEAFQLGYEYEG